MKKLAILAAALALSACSTPSEQTAAPSPAIHHPQAFGKSPPAADDNGVPLIAPSSPAPATQPAPWWAGTGRMAD
ncbi:hypothetical protein YS110_04900 [Acidovorax sp. YS12]|nr:hypothetical protein YS110_04900 [Acidovorax sp. YS12]